MDSAGNLYGTQLRRSCFLYFRWRLLRRSLRTQPGSGGSWSESVLVNFNRANGLGPQAGLVFDSAGIFMEPRRAAALTAMERFLSLPIRRTWTQSICTTSITATEEVRRWVWSFDTTGNLYGTTFSGGDLSACLGFGCGTVYELTPESGGTWSFQLLHRFNVTNGATPRSSARFFWQPVWRDRLWWNGQLLRSCGKRLRVGLRAEPVSGGAWREKIIKDLPESELRS